MNNVKSMLRSKLGINSLGVDVSKPEQELFIMRGLPGSGKSTNAAKLVGHGVIHSTDSVIERSNDYRKFFKSMVDNNDFSPLSKAHSTNLKEAILSMKNGISPVIIDNTNLTMSEPKAYVKAALELGYSDNNIKIFDIGTGGLSAEELADRNTHGVPLDKIKAMIQKYNSAGEMTVEKVLNSKDMYTQNNILYSAVVLDNESKQIILNTKYPIEIPSDWKIFAHHMTIAFGKSVPNKEDLGKTVVLTATHIGKSEKAMALRVTGYESTNKVPHITIAVSPDGKPVMSNDITNWVKIKEFKINGIVTNIEK